MRNAFEMQHMDRSDDWDVWRGFPIVGGSCSASALRERTSRILASHGCDRRRRELATCMAAMLDHMEKVAMGSGGHGRGCLEEPMPLYRPISPPRALCRAGMRMRLNPGAILGSSPAMAVRICQRPAKGAGRHLHILGAARRQPFAGEVVMHWVPDASANRVPWSSWASMRKSDGRQPWSTMVNEIQTKRRCVVFQTVTRNQ